MLSKEEIALVQNSWKAVDDPDLVAGVFYDILFSLNPQVRSLFPEQMQEQKKKLMDTIGLAVSSLTRLESLVPVLHKLGERHIDYEVTADQYDLVGEALLMTLEKVFADKFTIELRSAWAETYGILAATMKEVY